MPFACFVSYTVLGTIHIIFVVCPSPLLLPTYIGLWLRQLVDGPALWYHSRCAWLWAPISLQQALGSTFILLLPCYSLLALPLAHRCSVPGTGCSSSISLSHHPVRVTSKRGWMRLFPPHPSDSLGVMRGDPQ